MSLLEQTRTFVENLFKDKLSEVYLYHNFQHTSFTVNIAKSIAEDEQLSEEAVEKLLVAAWFHDTGYTVDPEIHEEKSVELAAAFLRHEGKSETYIHEVAQLILATKRYT